MKVFLLAVLLLAAKPAFPAFTAPVVDAAHVVPDDAEQRVDAQIQNYQQRSGNQIAVAVVHNTDGESLEDYSIDLARNWGVGQKGKNNGVLLLVVWDSHQLRIEVGSGLEGDITDLESGRIIRDIMAPRLRSGDVGGAIEAGVDGIEQAIGGELKPVPTAEPSGGSGPSKGIFALFPLLFFFLIFSGLFRRGRRRGSWWLLPVLLGSGWGRGGGFGGGFGSGGGLGGGGGFGGGGGGGFSGGGASGGW